MDDVTFIYVLKGFCKEGQDEKERLRKSKTRSKNQI